jgi:hypothetical protein
MSKKSKRIKARYGAKLPEKTAQRFVAKTTVPETKISTASSARVSSSSYESQYTYIIPELTRIGIIAGIVFIILIILSFVLK